MSDFLGNYGFFILIALLMLVCHLGHGGHDSHGGRDTDERGKEPKTGGHQH